VETQDFGREQRALDLAVKLELGEATADEMVEAASALSHTSGDRLRLENRVEALEQALAFFLRVMKIFDDLDARDSLWWNMRGAGVPLQFAVNCSNVFDLGTDFEDLTPENLHILEQAIEDVRKNYHSVAGGSMGEYDWALWLFCARIRARRPASMFSVPEDLRPLFNGAGPPR
jgi:hypothetical protein